MRAILVLTLLFNLHLEKGMAADALHPAAQIAAAEVVFAEQSVAEGMNTAFARHFSDDAVDFSPLPRENARQYYAGQPDPPLVLDWYPAYTLAAASGDFGLSTGPFVLSDPAGQRPARHGHYISVWERQPDGQWKVVIDGGSSHAASPSPVPALEPGRMNPNQLTAPRAWQGAETALLLEADRALSARSMQAGIVRALFEAGSEDLRIYRDGFQPVGGREAALKLLEGLEGAWRWEPQGGGIASSGDLGYTYGISFRDSDGKAWQGAYLRVWQRTPLGWRVILNRDNPVPERAG